MPTIRRTYTAVIAGRATNAESEQQLPRASVLLFRLRSTFPPLPSPVTAANIKITATAVAAANAVANTPVLVVGNHLLPARKHGPPDIKGRNGTNSTLSKEILYCCQFTIPSQSLKCTASKQSSVYWFHRYY